MYAVKACGDGQLYKQQERPQSCKWSVSEAVSTVYLPTSLRFRSDCVDASLCTDGLCFIHARLGSAGKQRSDLSPLISLITDDSSCGWNRENTGQELTVLMHYVKPHVNMPVTDSPDVYMRLDNMSYCVGSTKDLSTSENTNKSNSFNKPTYCHWESD